MTIAQEAVQQWAAQPALAFGVHLGDLCDGKAQVTDLGTDGSYSLVQSALDKAQLPFHYLIGNHDLYNYGHKARAAQALRPRGGAAVPEDEVDRPPGAAFYSFRPAPGGRVLLLDSYCFSALSGDATAADAEAFIRARNPNTDNLNSPKGLSGLDSRFVKLGGALGSAQLRWMEQQLAAARAAGESVVVLSHIPLNPAQLSPECGGLCLAWDYEAALAVIRPYNDTVLAVLSGHDHYGGAAQDEGIHFVTLPGVIETPRGGVSFGTVRVLRDRIEIRGAGRLRSRLLPFHRQQAATAAAPTAASAVGG